MKMQLLQELYELNQAFDGVLRGLARMERVKFFERDMLRYARAEVEAARVEANRQFFDNFAPLVEDDVAWAYKFQREFHQRCKDPEDLYLEVKEREEMRR
jgi:hypothetical protein